MAKVIGFKAIVTNMVESEISNMVYKRGGKFASIEKVEFDLTNKELGYPNFTASVKVDYNEYTVTGYVGEFGTVNICCVRYERMVCQEKDENGWWITESAKHVTRFVYGDALETFSFAD